jgi:hypothetical protein
MITLKHLKRMIRTPVNSRPSACQDSSAQAGILLNIVDNQGAAGDVRFQLGPKSILASPADTYYLSLVITVQVLELAQDNLKLQG